MRLNELFVILLFLTGLFLVPSCSVSKRSTYNKHDNKTVQDYEDKIYGNQSKKSKSDLANKTVYNDTIVVNKEESIIMPDAVDVSNYVPAFKRNKKEEKEEEIEEIADRVSPTSRSERDLRKDMVKYSKKFLGTPYKYGGKKPKTGFDCSGLTNYVYQNFGMQLSAASRYQAKDGKKVSPKFALPGDLLIFGSKGRINHVAMIVQNDKKGLFVIHSTNRGVVIDNILESSYWKSKMMYARKVIGE